MKLKQFIIYLILVSGTLIPTIEISAESTFNKLSSLTGELNGKNGSNVNGTSPTINGENPAGCIVKSRCFWFNIYNSFDAPVTFVVIPTPDTKDCYEGTVGEHTLKTGESQPIGIARVQGHGCNGKDGFFTVNINNPLGNASQNFTFDNQTGLAKTRNTTNIKYNSFLSERREREDGWAYYDWNLIGPWESEPVCPEPNCFQLFLTNSLDNDQSITMNIDPGSMTCMRVSEPVSTPIEAGKWKQVSLVYDCSGDDPGKFTLQISGDQTQDFYFNLYGARELTLSGDKLKSDYSPSLSTKLRNNSYNFSIDSTPEHDPLLAADGTGEWNEPDIKSIDNLKFTTEPYYPNYYDKCAGYPYYHPQHVIRLSNNPNGDAFFMVTQSRGHNGYLTLLKVEKEYVDETTDAIKTNDQGVAGKAIWQDFYSGEFNGHENPVGNFNHPGKMAVIDNVLVVAAQNWEPELPQRLACFATGEMGTSEDKLLFYDLQKIYQGQAPEFMGSMTANQLGLENGSLGLVGLIYNPIAKRYILVAGGDGKYTMLTASQLSADYNDWIAEPSASVVNFSGQHGLAFNVSERNQDVLWYFDADQGNNDKFIFTRFTYGDGHDSSFLTRTDNKVYNLELPGSDPDWTTSSIYVSDLDKKTIVYTVQSWKDMKDYQIYQVLSDR